MPDSQPGSQVETSSSSSKSILIKLGLAFLLVALVVGGLYLMSYLMNSVNHKEDNDSDDKYKKLEDRVTKLEDRVTKLESNNNDEDKPNKIGRTPRTSPTQKRT